MGDGGFWHNGLTSGIADAVFNNHDGIAIIIENGYSAATGGQLLPSSTAAQSGLQRGLSIERAVRGVGITWVRRVSTYDMKGTLRALREALGASPRGLKVIIAEGECQLNRQRRLSGLLKRWRAAGKRIARERFGVDEALCTGDRSCIRLSGCPSLTVKPSPDQLRQGLVATVDSSCVGCGVCGEVAHAATLCPSFYRAKVISNPNFRDRLLHAVRRRIIPLLSSHRAPSPGAESL
jgi:indolepyruvate ferredoxin oxidoreductase alpha subunit